jgi:transposase InsO family protein
MAAATSLREVIEALPRRVHTVLTDSGIQFTNRKRDQYAFAHEFGIARAEHGIEYRLTKVNPPWPNGRAERMNRTIKEATVKRYHYGSHDQLRSHLADFVAADDYGRRLTTLRGRTPYEHVVRCWTDEPDRFNVDPRDHVPEPNS